jgi:hypothetical protein
MKQEEYIKSGGICITADFVCSFGSLKDFINGYEVNLGIAEKDKNELLKRIWYEAQSVKKESAKHECQSDSVSGTVKVRVDDGGNEQGTVTKGGNKHRRKNNS